MATTPTVEPEVMQRGDMPTMRTSPGLMSIPGRILASEQGAWFAWGLIGGIAFAGIAIYIVKKKL